MGHPIPLKMTSLPQLLRVPGQLCPRLCPFLAQLTSNDRSIIQRPNNPSPDQEKSERMNMLAPEFTAWLVKDVTELESQVNFPAV